MDKKMEKILASQEKDGGVRPWLHFRQKTAGFHPLHIYGMIQEIALKMTAGVPGTISNPNVDLLESWGSMWRVEQCLKNIECITECEQQERRY
jgi:hypothetical protein